MAEDFQANNWWKSASSSTSAATSSRHPMEQLSGGGSPLSSPPIDWAPATLLGRAESSFQALLQEDLNSRDINHPFFFDNNLILDMNYQKQQSADMLDSHLHFTNNTLFWNASASSQPFDLPLKNLEGGRERKGSSEAPLKKIRVEATPSPLPAFKVRKEKLGDRITALQQLVSPFGKTDTASVLHEAIEYIKFLHDQVSVLSTPYLKNGQSMQQQQQSSEKNKREGEGQKQDLRSRGLCLVPISSTYPVASETTADFWTPTFGGTYR